MNIINLTQHAASQEQRDAGVVDIPAGMQRTLVELLTFDTLPSAEEIEDRAESIALMADLIVPEEGTHAAMIGGAMWLMAPLANALREQRITPLFAFSVRESVELTLPDGSVKKTTIFRHQGFVEAL